VDAEVGVPSGTLVEELVTSMVAPFDHVPDVFVFVKDSDRRFIACSLPFARLMGMRSRDELIGKQDEDLSPPHLVEHYRLKDGHVLGSGEPLVDEVELVRNSDGTYDWFVSTKTPVVYGGAIVGLVGVTRSLTKRDAESESLMSLTPAIEFISREYERPIDVAEMAAQVLMSPSHFSRLFRRHFGSSPYRYLRSVRLMAACDLLATTDLPVGVVGQRSGFTDASHFTKAFMSGQGMSPRQYRENNRVNRGYQNFRMALPRSVASGSSQPAEPSASG